MVTVKEFLRLNKGDDVLFEYVFIDSDNNKTELEAVKGLWYDNLPTNNTHYVNSDYVINDNDTLGNLTVVLSQDEFDNLIVTGFEPSSYVMTVYVERT